MYFLSPHKNKHHSNRRPGRNRHKKPTFSNNDQQGVDKSYKAKQNITENEKPVLATEKPQKIRDKKKKLQGMDLTSTLENYAETGNKYVKTIEQIIKQNRLSDFEPVRLTSSPEKKEFNL